MPLEFTTTHKFDKQVEKLECKIQDQFVKNLEFLLTDIKHPSLHTEKLSNGLYSFRINKNFRAIFRYVCAQSIELIFIANHDVYRKIKNYKI